MLLLLAGLAQAQTVKGGAVPELNAQLFRPSIDAKSTLWTDDSLKAPNGYTMARFALHYAMDPAVYVDSFDNRTELVSGLWQLSAMAAHTRGPLRIGVDLPIYLRSTGSAGGETGIGDLALDLRYTLLDRREMPVGLALTARTAFPTSTMEAPLGDGGMGWEFGVIVDRELGDKALIAANLGTRGVPQTKLENIEWNDMLYLRVGAGYQLSEATALSAELASHFTYAQWDPAGRPMELLVGGSQRVGESLVLRGGLGTGISAGLGAPRLRAIVSLGWEPPTSGPGDLDGDGILDPVDACVDVAEDLDGVADGDGCPEATKVFVEVVDPDGIFVNEGSWTLSGPAEASGAHGGEAELYGGSYTLRGSAEGFKPAELQVDIPDAESWTGRVVLGWIPGSLVVSAVDEAGKPIDGALWRLHDTPYKDIPAGTEQELPPGSYLLFVDAEGYRPIKQTVNVVSESHEEVVLTLLPAKAKVSKERIDIAESVYFETDKAIIKSASFSMLDDIAAILVAHPELTKIRIEGHTDSRGSDSHNLDLSQRRAEAVRQYLIDKGVEAERLEAVGHGETKPLDPAENAAAWEKNRRVDFFVQERSDK